LILSETCCGRERSQPVPPRHIHHTQGRKETIWTLHANRALPASASPSPPSPSSSPSSSSNQTDPAAIRDSDLNLIRAPGLCHPLLSFVSVDIWSALSRRAPANSPKSDQAKPNQVWQFSSTTARREDRSARICLHMHTAVYLYSGRYTTSVYTTMYVHCRPTYSVGRRADRLP
jgi:hypothetical protein